MLHVCTMVSMAPVLQLVPPPDANSIGERIRAARGHRTQLDMAKAIKVSARTLRGWENDEHSPTVKGIKAIANETGWPVLWLIDADATDADPDDGGPGATAVTAGYLRRPTRRHLQAVA